MKTLAAPWVLLDLEFWALCLQALSCGGYVAADYSRGFADDVESDASANKAFFVVLAWLGLGAAVCFRINASDSLFYPHKASESLNLFVATLYCISTATYLQVSNDVTKSFIADMVVFVEFFAAFSALCSSFLYCAVWHYDRNDGLPPHLRLKFTARLWLEFRTLDAQSQVWNIVPSVIYILAATTALLVHFYFLDALKNATGVDVTVAASTNQTPNTHGHQIAALRLASKVYVAGDTLFFLDSIIAAAAWFRLRLQMQAEDSDRRCRGRGRDEEEEEESAALVGHADTSDGVGSHHGERLLKNTRF